MRSILENIGGLRADTENETAIQKTGKRPEPRVKQLIETRASKGKRPRRVGLFRGTR